MQKWKRLHSETVYDSPFFCVKKDLVQLPDGQQKEWTYWDSTDSAMLLALTDNGELVMIRQYRYLVDDEVIEFPSGKMEGKETPAECARREFEEETGYAARGELEPLGSFFETYGQLNRRIHLFFTRSIELAEQRLDRGSKGFEDIRVELVPLEDAIRMAQGNRIAAMGSALSVLLLRAKLASEAVVR